VPSLASIEEMRTPAYEIYKEDNTAENTLKLTLTESKIPHLAVSSILQRTPFADLN
jgi:kinesin family protein 11